MLTKVDTSIEKRILSGMVRSSDYLREILPVYDPTYLSSNAIKIVAKWCQDYYEKYGEVPGKSVVEIFYDYADSAPEDRDLPVIEHILAEIVESADDSIKINTQYLIDQTMEFFRRRELEITSSKVKMLLLQGDLKKAEHTLLNYRKVVRPMTGWINPFDDDEIQEVMDRNESDGLLMPGELGNYLGVFERGWLVAITAPFKRGKTWIAMEFAIIAMMQGFKVVFISLEMTKKKVKERFFKRITAATEEGGEGVYPIFDCVRNQDGSCRKRERLGRKALGGSGKYKPKYYPDPEYIPCCVCRKVNADYEPCVWFETTTRNQLGYVDDVYNRLKAFKRMYGHRMRIKCYPRFSASLSDIERDLDNLSAVENFDADVVITDYIDILRADNPSLAGVEKEDIVWMDMAKLASTRNAVSITLTQGTRDSVDARTITEKHMSKWIGKLGHVDGMFTLNQTEKEKSQGIMRIGTLAHRHKDFSKTQFCTIIQDLSAGQPVLDSLDDIVIESEEYRGDDE